MAPSTGTRSPVPTETLANRVPSSASTATLTVRAPATTEQIGAVPDCTPADVQSAVTRAREAQAAWENTPVTERAAVLERFRDLVLTHRSTFLDILQLETGKSRRTAAGELLEIPSAVAHAVSRGPDVIADESRSGWIPLLTTATVTYEPVGVVGVISPWNFPLLLAFADTLPALIAGNSVVCKPDEKTPYGALFLADLLEQAGLPEGVFTVVTGTGSTVGPALIDHVDYVAFTGGTETGREVASRAGRNLIDCSLELGGHNPMVVLEDADVTDAARGGAVACFSNLGQICLAAERIYVLESAYEPFLEAFIDETERLTLGTDHSYEADLGSLIDERQLEVVERHVEEARRTGATVQTGGRHRPDIAPYCYEPTILTDLDPATDVACEETFGPVVSVQPVPDIETAIAKANDSAYGLNASVWCGDRARGKAVARQIDCGTVCVNDSFLAGWGADAPMGGFGDSGIGRRGGPEGIKRYLESRTIGVSRVGPLTLPDQLPTGWVVSAVAETTVVGNRLKKRVRSAISKTDEKIRQ